MELASRGNQVMKKSEYNLPLDPRPTLDAITQSICHAAQAKGLDAEIVASPEPYGVGSAFRKDRWFATMPNYQDDGTSVHAQEPGVMKERGERRAPKRQAAGEPLKPTRDWPKESRFLSSDICRGSEECEAQEQNSPFGRISSGGCNRLWRKHSRAVFEAFIAANPEVMFRRKNLQCVAELTPPHRNGSENHRHMDGWPIDHAEICRLPDGSRFIISQTYCKDELCNTCLEKLEEWQKTIPRLTWTAAGRERSWYFPGSANLIVLADEATLGRLVLDYLVPEETKPTGCRRYGEKF